MPRLQAVLALILLAAFFLPWFGSDTPSSVAEQSFFAGENSGFGIVLSAFQTLQSNTGSSIEVKILSDWPVWALLAIPFFGLLALFTGLSGARITALFAFLAGVVPVGETVYGFVEAGANVFQLFDFGAYITLAAGLLLVLTSFVPRRAGI